MRKPLNIGFVVFEGLEELDLVGPYEVFSYVSKLIEGAVNTFTVARHAQPIRCFNGLKIVPDYTFEDCPPINVIVIPGGRGRLEAMNDVELLSFVKETARKADYTTSVCTGAFILAKAGLLRGKKATTWHGSLEELRRFGDIEVREERVVHEGRIVTAAGVSSGIDMAFYVVGLIFGRGVADEVAERIEYRRP